jgi:hypothetical protein
MKAPRSVQLPGGRVIDLRAPRDTKPRSADTPEMIFGGAHELFDDESLSLAEFHALRAIATRLGWLEEDEVEITCRNCGEKITTKPCASMPLGPFADAELGDEELDALLPLGEDHEIEPIQLDKRRNATTIRFEALTAKAAKPLHRALAKRELLVNHAIVAAMGITALGEERDRAVIARALSRADDRAFGTVTNLFLEAHYPLRLFAPAVCASCGSRNDVDAPYDREFSPHRDEERTELFGQFPSFDEFDALARKIAQTRMDAEIVLVVEGGVPDCDDGGEPLLGSYVPAHEGGAGSPVKAAEITVYYKTFEAMWNEDGAYDVDAELTETIEHELEHHEAALIGHDPKDDEERDEIAREAQRVIGKKALARAATNELGSDIGEFLKRTWIVWVVALIVAMLALLGSR